MRVDGQWVHFDDGGVRPVVRGDAIAYDGTAVEIVFLVDTGSDRSVFSKDILDALGYEALPSSEQLVGVGGYVNVVEVQTIIRLVQDDGRLAAFRGRYKAVTDALALDISILGRDILAYFALIVDQAGDTLCLLRTNHHYVVTAI